jgi:C4-dicarboxylate transporter DctM subunit
MLLFIIANALILKHVLAEERIPQMIIEAMLSAGLGPIMFLFLIIVTYLPIISTWLPTLMMGPEIITQ